MEDLVFDDFCAEIGVNSIREYEQEHLKHQSELDKKRYDTMNTLSLEESGKHLYIIVILWGNAPIITTFTMNKVCIF